MKNNTKVITRILIANFIFVGMVIFISLMCKDKELTLITQKILSIIPYTIFFNPTYKYIASYNTLHPSNKIMTSGLSFWYLSFWCDWIIYALVGFALLDICFWVLFMANIIDAIRKLKQPWWYFFLAFIPIIRLWVLNQFFRAIDRETKQEKE